MSDHIKQIKLPNDNIYDIALAKSLTIGSKTYNGTADIAVAAADFGLDSAMKFIGTTTTVIADENTTNPIIIDGKYITVTNGNVVIYGTKEFIWTGSKWEEFGNEGNYKVVQTAVSSPSASSVTTTAFIDTISQNTQGVITATKKKLPTASTSISGIVQLSTATDSTSTELAATSSAVKAAYDLAASKATMDQVNSAISDAITIALNTSV